MADFLWKLAIVIDILHMVVVVPVILLAGAGKLFGKLMGPAFVFTVGGLQAAFLGCPLTYLTGWMRHFKDPHVNPNRASLTHWLYAHLGAFGSVHWLLSGVFFIIAGKLVHKAIMKKRSGLRVAGSVNAF